MPFTTSLQMRLVAHAIADNQDARGPAGRWASCSMVRPSSAEEPDPTLGLARLSLRFAITTRR